MSESTPNVWMRRTRARRGLVRGGVLLATGAFVAMLGQQPSCMPSLDSSGGGTASPAGGPTSTNDPNLVDQYGITILQVDGASVACWDLNQNGVADGDEDRNGDGMVDVLDCQGAAGATGATGTAGAAGAAGANGSGGTTSTTGGGAAATIDATTVLGVRGDRVGMLVGEVRMWAGPIARIPAGWRLCDGAALPRTTYARLFQALGTIYGAGDGTTTFNLPDFRDRGAIGARDDYSGVPMTTVAGRPTQTGGEAAHALSVGELPPHNHDISHTHDVNLSLGLGAGSMFNLGLLGSGRTFTTGAPSTTLSGLTGSGAAMNVLDPYQAIAFIIYTGN